MSVLVDDDFDHVLRDMVFVFFVATHPVVYIAWPAQRVSVTVAVCQSCCNLPKVRSSIQHHMKIVIIYVVDSYVFICCMVVHNATSVARW